MKKCNHVREVKVSAREVKGLAREVKGSARKMKGRTRKSKGQRKMSIERQSATVAERRESDERPRLKRPRTRVAENKSGRGPEQPRTRAEQNSGEALQRISRNKNANEGANKGREVSRKEQKCRQPS
jgi:hypothetical protein